MPPLRNVQQPNLSGFSQAFPFSQGTANNVSQQALQLPGQQQNNAQDVGQLGALAGFGGPVGLALGLGSELFGFLGARDQRKKQERGFDAAIGGLQGQVGENVLDVNRILQSTRAANDPRIREQGKKFDARFGFDQGASAQAIIRALAEREPEQFTQLFTQNQLRTSARDDALRNQIIQLQLQKSQL